MTNETPSPSPSPEKYPINDDTVLRMAVNALHGERHHTLATELEWVRQHLASPSSTPDAEQAAKEIFDLLFPMTRSGELDEATCAAIITRHMQPKDAEIERYRSDHENVVDWAIAHGYDMRPGLNAGGLTAYGLVKQLESELAAAREGLKFYADPLNHIADEADDCGGIPGTSPIDKDEGAIARRTLSSLESKGGTK